MGNLHKADRVLRRWERNHTNSDRTPHDPDSDQMTRLAIRPRALLAIVLQGLRGVSQIIVRQVELIH